MSSESEIPRSEVVGNNGPQVLDPPIEKNFSAHLRWHLEVNGTRPKGCPGQPGDVWDRAEFAQAIASNKSRLQKGGKRGDPFKNLNNWLMGHRCQVTWLRSIEEVLFGNSTHYSHWRAQLREAHSSSRKIRKTSRSNKSPSLRTDVSNDKKAEVQLSSKTVELIAESVVALLALPAEATMPNGAIEAKKSPSIRSASSIRIINPLSSADEKVLDYDLASSSNPHLFSSDASTAILRGRFGALFAGAFKIGKFVSSWIGVVRAATGGFRSNEINVLLDPTEVAPPLKLANLASSLRTENERRRSEGLPGWFDSETFCLSSVQNAALKDEDENERPSTTIHLQRSWYRYNIAARSEAWAPYRSRALKKASLPLKPVPYLASSVGICINVICDDGRSIIASQRSGFAAHRKGEFDVGIVVGMRPSLHSIGGRIDMISLVRSEVIEGLGLGREVKGDDAGKLIKGVGIFELGCDLEYYQWGFLAFVEVGLDFETIQQTFDQGEASRLHRIPNDKRELFGFCLERPVWSLGLVCALRTLDYWRPEISKA